MLFPQPDSTNSLFGFRLLFDLGLILGFGPLLHIGIIFITTSGAKPSLSEALGISFKKCLEPHLKLTCAADGSEENTSMEEGFETDNEPETDEESKKTE